MNTDTMLINEVAQTLGMTMDEVRALDRKGVLKSSGRTPKTMRPGNARTYRRIDVLKFKSDQGGTTKPAKPATNGVTHVKATRKAAHTALSTVSDEDFEAIGITVSLALKASIKKACKMYQITDEDLVRRYVVDGLIKDKILSVG